MRPVRRPRTGRLDPLFVRAMTWTPNPEGLGHPVGDRCLDPLFVRAMTWTLGISVASISGAGSIYGLDPLFVRAMTWTVIVLLREKVS